MKLLISACLLGLRCRYDGESKADPRWEELARYCTLIPVCPEQLGGLATPRPPAERCGDRVLTAEGTDVTAQYRRGAEEALKLYDLADCRGAILKERSPSCGCGTIHDGTFSGGMTAGDGVTAELLKRRGIPVYGESRIEEVLERLKTEQI